MSSDEESDGLCEDEAQEWGDWIDVSATSVMCLVCNSQHGTAQEVFAHCAKDHRFDFYEIKKNLGLDQYGCLKLINFLRKCDSPPEPADLKLDDFKDDEFLIPVLKDDPLLQIYYEDDDDIGATSHLSPKRPKEGNDRGKGEPEQYDEIVFRPEHDEIEEKKTYTDQDTLTTTALRSEVSILEKELLQLQASFAAYRKQTESLLLGSDRDSIVEDAAKFKSAELNNVDTENLDYYFHSYSHHGIHEEMLKDTVRTKGYQDFILSNPNLFKDKVVLDVGCGTGILSMFAADAGARLVIGVDNSHVLAHAHANVISNGYEGRITLIRGKVEEIDLPVDKVDVIISEWMGYFLYYESMLDTVLYARDKWLSPGGHVHPDLSDLYLAAVCDDDLYHSKVNFWDEVYGYDMSSLKPGVFVEPLLMGLKKDTLISQPCVIKSIDAHNVKIEDYAEFLSSFLLVIRKEGRCSALCSYFDIVFERGCDKVVFFTTGPEGTLTHWKQTVFLLENPIDVTIGDVIEGSIHVTRCKRNHRSLNMKIKYQLKSLNGEDSKEFTQDYKL